MYYGYYGEGLFGKDYWQVQFDLVNVMLEWGSVQQVFWILDVGCGVGGSFWYLVEKLQVKYVLGCILSIVQVECGIVYNWEVVLSNIVKIEVWDMMFFCFEDGLFDLVWFMESVEYIEDKV